MISVLVIAHEPLATALIHCTRHIFKQLPRQVAALDVVPDEDPEAALEAARGLATRINDGSGLVVLTDVYGATPSRIAAKLAEPFRVVVFHGVNLPMLLKALTYRRDLPLEALADKIVEAAPASLGLINPLLDAEAACGSAAPSAATSAAPSPVPPRKPVAAPGSPPPGSRPMKSAR
ncbi:MAG: PTS sugar transporter subunit IIA [Lautropia sp.]